MYTRRSWQEKMDPPDLPKIVAIRPKWQRRFGESTLLVPSPREVDALIRKARKGDLVTVSRLRQDLPAKYASDMTCPLTTGIFVRISAEAAEEEARAGKHRITPYWRVVKDDGSLNPKFPGGVKRQAERLRAEGHGIVPGKGKRPPRAVLARNVNA